MLLGTAQVDALTLPVTVRFGSTLTTEGAHFGCNINISLVNVVSFTSQLLARAHTVEEDSLGSSNIWLTGTVTLA